MKVSTSLKLNITRFVQQAIMMQAENHGSAVDAFIEFVNTDRAFKLKLQRSLMSRLKYSTGKLYESIRIKATRDERVSVNEFGGITASYKVDVFIDIDDSRGKGLINALLGEKEQKKDVDLPAIKDLIKWVSGKRRFFDKQIDAIKSRQDRVKKLLQIQRMELGGSGEFNLPKNDNIFAKDPVREIAQLIQRRMAMRMAKGLSPTKGSEFVFLGNYPDYSSDGKDTSSFAPKYREMSEPLLRKRKKEESGKLVGEMNRILKEEASQYLINVMEKYIKSGLKIDVTKEAKESELKLDTGTQYKNQVINQIRSIAPKFISRKLDTAINLEESMFSLFEQVKNVRNRTKSKWFKEGQDLIMSEIMTTSKFTMKLAKDEGLSVSKEIDDIIVRLRNFGGYVAPVKKRPARRRR